MGPPVELCDRGALELMPNAEMRRKRGAMPYHHFRKNQGFSTI
jgi:hypothetical protein